MPSFEDQRIESAHATYDVATRRGDGLDLRYRGNALQENETPEGGKLGEYAKVVWRNKLPLLVTLCLGVGAGIAIRKSMGPRYQSQAVVEVRSLSERFLNREQFDPRSANRDVGIEFYLQTQLRLLESDEMLRRLARKVTAEPASRDRWSRTLGVASSDLEQGSPVAMNALQNCFSARIITQTRLIEVACVSKDPKFSSEAANTLAEEFIHADAEAQREAMAQTGRLLAGELTNLRNNLDHAGQKLQEYARDSNLLYTGKQDNIQEGSVSQTQTELVAAKGQRIEKQARFEQAGKANPDSLPDVLNDVTLKDYRTSLAGLRRELADLTSTLAPGHYKVKKVKAQIEQLEAESQAYRDNILKRISNEYDAAARREELLSGSYSDETAKLSEQSAKAVGYQMLKSELDTNRQLYEAMLQRVKEAQVISAMGATSMRLVDPAWPAPAPKPPTIPQSGVLGALGGLSLGLAFVMWREYSGTAFRDPTEAARFLQVPELGAIPPHAGKTRFPALRQIASAGSGEVQLPRLSVEDLESYRGVMASLACAGWNSILGCCIVVTSPVKGDGKTRTTASLGIALAKAGRRTLLVGGDLRQPELHTLFGVGNDAGLRDLLEEGASANVDSLIQPTGVANLHVLPSGPPVSDSMHLLDSNRLPEVLRSLKKRYDTILIDSPPVLQLADARMLARLSQGTILVVRAGHTPREAAQAARFRLAGDGIEVAGLVLNDSPVRDSYYRYHAERSGRSAPSTRA